SPLARVETKKNVTRQVCPLLLRCFWRTHQHHRPEEFGGVNGPLPKDELQIYTWCA
ncbi:unnamed protein product, partial [Discosporangium mesarthrocarpum]